MVRLHARTEVAGHERGSITLNAPDLLVQLVDNRGIEVDTRPFNADAERLGAGKTTLTVVLEGNYATQRARPASKGHLVWEHRVQWRERWSGAHQRFVTLAWPTQRDPDASTERLGPAAIRAWTDVADALERSSSRTEDVVARVRAACASAGLQPPLVQDTPPPGIERLAHALSRATTQLHLGPQWIDVARWSGMSERQLRRLFSAHARWLRSKGLREAIGFQRLKTAVSLLAADGLTSARVARALGYGSNRAMYTALRRAGLSPR